MGLPFLNGGINLLKTQLESTKLRYMKKVLVVFVMALGFGGCNEESTTINVNRDSLGRELDTLGNKIGEKAEQVWDSAKVKATDLKENIEARLDSVGNKRKDTL